MDIGRFRKKKCARQILGLD